MDAVREPGPRAEPSAIVEIVERAAAVELLAEAVLVLGFGEMGVQPARRSLRRELRGRSHQRASCTENGEQGASAICTMAPSARW